MLDKKCLVEGKGLSCPSCGSLSIQGGFVEIEAGRAYQRMGCTECDATWQDVYELTCRIPDTNSYPEKEVNHEPIRDQTPGLAGVLG